MYLDGGIHLCELDLTTQDIKENIDHIFLPKAIASKFQVLKDIFVEKNLLSDHQGIRISIKEKYIS